MKTIPPKTKEWLIWMYEDAQFRNDLKRNDWLKIDTCVDFLDVIKEALTAEKLYVIAQQTIGSRDTDLIVFLALRSKIIAQRIGITFLEEPKISIASNEVVEELLAYILGNNEGD